jgi:hypothetical protein
MTGHMPSIRQQGHGSESPSGKDLHNHGHAGQPENGPRTLLSTPMIMVIMGTRMGHACLLVLFDSQKERKSNN